MVAVVQDDGSVAWIEMLGGEPQPAHTDALPANASDATVH